MVEGVRSEQGFDGIVCIGGEDWWYHNRGHFDFQIMRRLARKVPVLFVNSIGVRLPNPVHDKQFARRVGRKLQSYARGLVEAEPGFWVFSPVVVPGRSGQALTQWALAPQIRLAARRAGISRPVLWVHCPAGAELIGQMPSVLTVMQRTDRFEAFPDGDPRVLGPQIARIKDAADLVVYCAGHLANEEHGSVRRQLVTTHGVDLERFAAAAGAGHVPSDVAGIASPRIGFIGGIDHHTFDPELFLAVADRLGDAQFVLVGGCSLPEGWTGGRANVHLVGRKPYEHVADYMAAMDVLIMPWNRSEWIKACNPIKLKEYLAVRRPVVTTDFPALDGFRDAVRVAGDADGFAGAIRNALVEPAPDLLARLASETWDHKAAAIFREMTAILASGSARDTAGRDDVEGGETAAA